MFCIRQDSGKKDGRMYKLLTTLKIGYNPVPILAKKKKNISVGLVEMKLS
jgi:hypothetical protein